jgi:hypothetical protein
MHDEEMASRTRPRITPQTQISNGAAGAQTRKSLGDHLLHPLILRLLVLCAPTVLRPKLSRMHLHPQIQIPNAFPV